MATVVMAMAAMTAMVGKEIAAAIEQPKRARSWLDHKHGRACGPWRPGQRFPAGVSAIGFGGSIRHWIALRYSPPRSDLLPVVQHLLLLRAPPLCPTTHRTSPAPTPAHPR